MSEILLGILILSMIGMNVQLFLLYKQRPKTIESVKYFPQEPKEHGTPRVVKRSEHILWQEEQKENA